MARRGNRFRVLWGVESRERRRKLEALGCPRTVPWSLLEPHEQQAQINHMQSLARLNERGGLSPMEMVCVIEERPVKRPYMTDEEAVRRLLEHLNKHEEK